jgi:hypothetical protein
MEKSPNLYWLAGDRYVCIRRKKDLLTSLNSQKEYDIIEFTSTNADEFASMLNRRAIFGNQKKILVHDGSVPEPSKTSGIIKKLSSDKILIVIEGNPESTSPFSKIDKRTQMYKTFSSNIEEFDSVIQDNGYPDKKKIPKAIEIIRFLSPIVVSDDVIKILLEKMDYNIGRTCNEIEKLSIYVDSIKDFNKISHLVSEKTDPAIDKLLEKINNKDFKNAIIDLNYIIEYFNFDLLFVPFFINFIDAYTFMMHCKLANMSNVFTAHDIGLFVSEHWIKNGKNVDAYSSEKRYFVFKNYIDKLDIDYIIHALKCAEKSIEENITKIGPPRYIANLFLRNLASY